MQSECPNTDAPAATSAERSEINYAKIIKAYIAHVLDREGTNFIYFDSDLAALPLSDAEAAELVRLRDEVDAACER